MFKNLENTVNHIQSKLDILAHPSFGNFDNDNFDNDFVVNDNDKDQ